MPPQEPQNNTPISNPLDGAHRGKSIWLLIALGFVLIAINLYFFCQNYFQKSTSQDQNLTTIATSTDQFSDWKTYRNEEYGFEFKYPPTLYIDKTPTGVIEIIYSEDKNIGHGLFPGIWIYIKNNDSKLNLIDWWKKFGSHQLNEVYPEHYSLKEIEVNGIKGIHVPGGEGVLESHILLQQNNKIFDFLIMVGIKEQDQILSTFKFISTSTSALDTSEKTYRNEEFGFEIQYPDFISVWEYMQEGPIHVAFEPTYNKKDYGILIYPGGGYDEDSQLPSKSYTRKISGKQAQIREYTGEYGSWQIINVSSPPSGWNKDNKIILIYSSPQQKEFVEYYAFSTFKFTK